MSTELKLGAIVTLKPLEWTYVKNQYGDESYSAPTVFCQLEVYKAEDSTRWYFKYCVDEYYDEGYEYVDSPEAGKARAEEWYLSRSDELVAALKEAIGTIGIFHGREGWQEYQQSPEMKRFFAALAKVEGGA